MNRKITAFSIVIVLAGVLSMGSCLAQKPLNPQADKGPKTKIELIKADSLVGTSGITQTRTFIGNVQFRHRGIDLFCQKAIHYSGENNLTAYGDIYINQGDTLSITGDTLFYAGDSRQAKIFGKEVVLKDDSTTLTSTQINYNLNNDLAFYPKPGLVVRDSNTLRSNTGYYNTQTKKFRYYGDVEIINPDQIVCTDTLLYDSNSGLSKFYSTTVIKSKDGELISDEGTYNLKTGQSRFVSRSMVSNEKYSLEADTLNFNTETNEGIGVGNVIFHSIEDQLFLYGDYGERKASTQSTKMIGNTITKIVQERDTLYMSSDSVIIYGKRDLLFPSYTSADTTRKDLTFLEPALKSNLTKKPNRGDSLLTITDTLRISRSQQLDAKNPTNLRLEAQIKSENDSIKKVEFIIAKGKVKIYRHDFQASCDSLTYDLIDSTIAFFEDPVIWNKDSQMLADSIKAFLRNNKVRQMNLNKNSYVISVDTARNFNQVKGRKVIAFFDSTTAISQVDVNGNGESVYYALDDFNKIVAMNKVLCSKMNLFFRERKVDKIAFIGRPEGQFIPPLEIGANTGQLEGFDWRVSEKPTKKEIINSRNRKHQGNHL